MRKSFTLVEMIIVIIVFGIGVLSVFSIILYNLTFADRVKNDIVATMLAKEGIEVPLHIKQTNVSRFLPWNCFQSVKSASDSITCPSDNAAHSFLTGNRYTLERNPQYTGDTNPISSNYNQRMYYRFTGYNDSVPTKSAPGKAKLYFDPSTRLYSHDSALSGTYFGRYILFSGATLKGGVHDGSQLMKIESVVLLRKGGYSKEYRLESFIGDNQ